MLKMQEELFNVTFKFIKFKDEENKSISKSSYI